MTYIAQQIRRRSGPEIRATRYEQFKGVDFSGDPTKISSNRFAYAQNIVIDDTGYPQKRLGHRTLYSFANTIYGLYIFDIYEDNEYISHYLVHAGNTLYKTEGGFNGTPTELYTAMNTRRSKAFLFENKVYIIDGINYLVYDGNSVSSVSESAYIPLTTSNIAADGAGTSVEAINTLTAKRKNTCVGDGTTTTFTLDGAIKEETTPKVYVDGEENTAFTIDYAAGKITFTTAPPIAATGEGTANIEVIFEAASLSEANGSPKNCTFFTTMQYGNGRYFFFSGNDKFPNVDYASGINDPTYFPDTNYAYYGASGRCMGYATFGTYVVMFKETAQTPTIYARSASSLTLNNVENVVFPIEAIGGEGIGAINTECIGTLGNEALMLTKDGVFALTSLSATSNIVTRNRSEYINAELLQEESLENSAACIWRNRYILSVNGVCYVLDNNLPKSYISQSNGEYSYEATYWTNIDAHVFCVHQGNCYFGTTDGNIKRFNNDISTSDRFNDDNVAIHAIISTKADDDNDFMTTKTLRKKGSGLMLKPYNRSSVIIYISTTKDLKKLLRGKTMMDIFDFGDVDFERFTFNTLDVPQVIPFLKKEKKYITLQFTLENNELSEGFGVYGIIKRYTYQNYVKR